MENKSSICHMTKQRLIDANALMEHLNRCIEQSKGLMKSVCVAIKCFVEQMPTVDAVEVVHGRWEHDSIGFSDFWTCSACRKDFFFDDDPTVMHARVNYCPNCGAKMDGGNEDG